MRSAIMAITINNSIRVKARRIVRAHKFIVVAPKTKEKDTYIVALAERFCPNVRRPDVAHERELFLPCVYLSKRGRPGMIVGSVRTSPEFTLKVRVWGRESDPRPDPPAWTLRESRWRNMLSEDKETGREMYAGSTWAVTYHWPSPVLGLFHMARVGFAADGPARPRRIPWPLLPVRE
jgi:hypothetical protein